MRPLCVLVGGTDLYFEEGLDSLDAYLQSIGCRVIRLNVREHKIIPTLKNAIRNSSNRRPLMLAFKGHGSEFGWEYGTWYLPLAATLARHRGNLIILNDTCHGFKFRHYLRLFRSPRDTGLIVNWDGEGAMYGGTFEDALRYWPHSTIVENEVSGNTYSREGGTDKVVPIQLRWGATLDHLFFPDPSP